MRTGLADFYIAEANKKRVKMTPAQQAKAEGLRSLSAVSEMTGVSLQTLTNWHRDKPKLFAVVLAGCKALST